MSEEKRTVPADGTMLQNFRNYYMQCGQTTQCILDFIEAQDEMLRSQGVDIMNPPAGLKAEISEFYEYFAGNFGDSDEVMGSIEKKFGQTPPAVLLIGFQTQFERGERAVAEKYTSRVREGSREEYNISQLASFIAPNQCHISIIGPEEYSYEIEWPVEVSSPDLTNVQLLKGMLSDFLFHGQGMIVRLFREPKDEVYGFLPDDGGVEAMEIDRLAFALGVQADEEVKEYLNHVVISKAGLSFR